MFSSLEAKLKPYQLEGLSFLLYLRKNGIGGILGDEMGLGKTLQTLALFQYVVEAEGTQSSPFLVVCPLSVMDTWVSEASKWTPNLEIVKYHGEARADVKSRFSSRKTVSSFYRIITSLGLISGQRYATLIPNPDIVITTYEMLIIDVQWFQRTCTWRYVVLDEGHHIKNAETKRFKALRRIRAEFKLVLTG